MLQTQGASYGKRPMNILCISQAPTQAKGFMQFSVMSPSYQGNGLSFGGIGSLDDIIESFRLHVVGGGKDLYGTTKHQRVQPLLRHTKGTISGIVCSVVLGTLQHYSSAIFWAASHDGWCHLRRVRHHHDIVLDSGAIPDAGRHHFNVVSGVQKSIIFRRCRHYFQTSFKRHLPVRSTDLSAIASIPNAIQVPFWCRGWGCFPVMSLQRCSGGGAIVWRWKITVPVMATTFHCLRHCLSRCHATG
ncbi:hypothetical protein VitviT2T_013705 [Vitis vinifera]|uniref:Uncharacterized protein n=1 Tax=Vitis vinifera TaxID=29760 RepID=A0ABY9CK06_VITVI|nr:hypothetical protein VitviT2T_013705 [Vitis vinifera]